MMASVKAPKLSIPRSRASIRASKATALKGSTALVEEAIASIPYPMRPDGLIEILEPKPPLLPVELPPIAERRLEKHQDGQASVRKSIKTSNVVPFIEGDDIPNPFSYPKNVEQFIQMLDVFKAKVRRRYNIPFVYLAL